VQRAHFVETERFGAFSDMLAETIAHIASAGPTAPGTHFPYPDKNIYESPPGGIAVESVHFVGG